MGQEIKGALWELVGERQPRSQGLSSSHPREPPSLKSNPVALPVLYFYWSLYPVAAIVLSGGFIVSILLPIVSFSNHRPRLRIVSRSTSAICCQFFLTCITNKVCMYVCTAEGTGFPCLNLFTQPTWCLFF